MNPKSDNKIKTSLQPTIQNIELLKVKEIRDPDSQHNMKQSSSLELVSFNEPMIISQMNDGFKNQKMEAKEIKKQSMSVWAINES